MKKFFVKSTNKELKIGDTITLEFVTDTPFGEVTATKILEVTGKVLETLIKDDKVIMKEVKPNHNIIVAAALNKLACKFKCSKAEMLEILYTIKKVNPWAAVQLLLKEIAVELDMQYSNHISNSEEFYSISPQDEEIHKIDKKTIKSFSNAPWFRTMEDAQIAKKIIMKFLTLGNKDA